MVEELLRYDPAVHSVSNRTTLAPIEVGGVSIPAGRRLVLVLAAANRDPAVFSQPNELDPARQRAKHWVEHVVHAPQMDSCVTDRTSVVVPLSGATAINLEVTRSDADDGKLEEILKNNGGSRCSGDRGMPPLVEPVDVVPGNWTVVMRVRAW